MFGLGSTCISHFISKLIAAYILPNNAATVEEQFCDSIYRLGIKVVVNLKLYTFTIYKVILHGLNIQERE